MEELLLHGCLLFFINAKGPSSESRLQCHKQVELGRGFWADEQAIPN